MQSGHQVYLVLNSKRAARTLWLQVRIPGRPNGRKGRVRASAPGTPTPAGRFWIREKLKGFGGVYGPVAFATATSSGWRS